ncbi:MAG: hypothetical protein AB7V32_00770 [Candidatus Berkiella sp.]
MDDKDNDAPGDKKPPMPKQVVVTHYGKKKKDDDVPSEIVPTEPTHIISSPVDIGATLSRPAASSSSVKSDKPTLSTQDKAQPKPQPKVEPAITPAYSYTPKQAMASQEIFPQGQEEPQQSASYASSTSTKEPYSGGSMPPQTPSDEQRPPSGGSGGGGALFFSVISLIAVIVLGYYANRNYHQLSELQQLSSDDQSSMQALAEQTKKTLAQVQSENEKTSQSQQALDELKKQLMGAQANLVTLSGNTDWVLAEANYLAFMANERLKTAQDVTTSLAQLSAAD